ncbi:MAG: flagellar hook-length control protein FliK [Porticoccaceae bacterium]
MAQLGLRSDALEQLKRSLNRFEGLSNPGALQKALQQSGFFLESQLRQLVLSGGYLPEGDIKAELLRILDRVNRKIGAKSGDTEEELDALFLLKERLESGLAGITLQQVASFKRNEGGHQGWFFEIPYRTDDGVETLTILIERDNASLDEHEDRQDWKVLLSLELKPLGEMQAELFLRGKRISVVIYSEQEKTAQLVNSQLDALKLGLESRGLEVSVLRCQSGIRDVKKKKVFIDVWMKRHEQQVGNKKTASSGTSLFWCGCSASHCQGEGATAEKISEIAERYEIPLIQDASLTSLLSTVPLGDEIPENLYLAVAEVLAHVYRISGMIDSYE